MPPASRLLPATALFSLLGVAFLAAARFRSNRPALKSRGEFGSEHFSDEEILEQLRSSKYQARLASHEWRELELCGPCFSKIAEAMIVFRLSLASAIKLQSDSLDPNVLKVLLQRLDVVRAAMREIAESYLARGIKTESQTQLSNNNQPQNDFRQVPDIVLAGSGGRRYRPVKFIARGSAGAVYTCVRVTQETSTAKTSTDAPLQGSQATAKFKAAVNAQLQRQLALKRIEPTQKDSAENEFRIASLLAEHDANARCVPYLDRMEESPEHLWLLLRRITASPYGIDLSEYIEGGFFSPENEKVAREMVVQLLDGIEYISSRGVCMRDVKADNVLVKLDVGEVIADSKSLSARWSDFGLSVDLGEEYDASGIRSPKKALLESNGAISDEKLQRSLVGFWYDTQKLVPKPKWRFRRPPENLFRNPMRVHVSSFDLYMFGIIVASMATGLDIAHIDRPRVKEDFEALFKTKLSEDYLESFELGAFLRENESIAEARFQLAWGETFGAQLFEETKLMLRLDPRDRPRPSESLARISKFL